MDPDLLKVHASISLGVFCICQIRMFAHLRYTYCHSRKSSAHLYHYKYSKNVHASQLHSNRVAFYQLTNSIYKGFLSQVVSA